MLLVVAGHTLARLGRPGCDEGTDLRKRPPPERIACLERGRRVHRRLDGDLDQRRCVAQEGARSLDNRFDGVADVLSEPRVQDPGSFSRRMREITTPGRAA